MVLTICLDGQYISIKTESPYND